MSRTTVTIGAFWLDEYREAARVAKLARAVARRGGIDADTLERAERRRDVAARLLASEVARNAR